ncbi:branched-chain amino acid ABC transporter permease [Chloroflexota bacterium]
MDLATFINLTLAGITLGTVYLLMAMGLTLVYGVTRVFNYAQGSFFSWSGYFAWYLSVGVLGWNYYLVIPITLVAMFIAGMIFEKVIILPLRRLPGWDFTVIIVTLGCSLALDNLILATFGPLSKTIPHLLTGTLEIGNLMIAKHDVLMILIGILVFIALQLFLSKTWIGLGLRAVSQDNVGAKIVGLPLNSMYTVAFGIAGLLSAVAVILLAPRTLLYPLVGWTTLLKAFVVMVLGGLGNVKGTVIAAFALSIAEIFISYFVGGIWAMPIFIGLLVVLLVFKPKGLFGSW